MDALAVASDLVDVAGVDDVVTGSTRDRVRVTAGQRVDDVVARAAAHGAAGMGVAAQADRVVAGAAVDRVAADPALELVVARAAVDDIDGRAAEDPVVARAALEDVGPAVAALDLVLGPD